MSKGFGSGANCKILEVKCLAGVSWGIAPVYNR